MDFIHDLGVFVAGMLTVVFPLLVSDRKMLNESEIREFKEIIDGAIETGMEVDHFKVGMVAINAAPPMVVDGISAVTSVVMLQGMSALLTEVLGDMHTDDKGMELMRKYRAIIEQKRTQRN